MERKILIIENDRRTRDLLIQGFSHNGFQIFTAADGRNALFQFGVTRPDLIILNTLLPGKDGWETLQRLRELSTVPIIALVAFGDEEAKLKSLRWGADHYMTKPLSVRELHARVLALLRRTQYIASLTWQSQPVRPGSGLVRV